MVKSKKKISGKGRHLIKSKKLQHGSGYAMPQGPMPMGGQGLSGYSFGNLKYKDGITTGGLEKMAKLQDTTKQAKYIISAIEAPKWGTSKGASSYTKIKNSLMSVRRNNIESIENIVNILGESTTSKQKRAMTEIRKLAGLTNGSSYQTILQNKRNIESSFKNLSVPRKNDKSELYNTVSQRVHLARSNVLEHLAALVRIETLQLNAVLMRVVKDKGSESFVRETE